jgi:hypothetical protein
VGPEAGSIEATPRLAEDGPMGSIVDKMKILRTMDELSRGQSGFGIIILGEWSQVVRELFNEAVELGV